MAHVLFSDQEIGNDTDEEKDNIPQPTMGEVQTMLPDICRYYQLAQIIIAANSTYYLTFFCTKKS